MSAHSNESEREIQPASALCRGDDDIDLASIVAVLWRRRWFIFAVVFVFFGLAFAYCVYATPKYEITAQVMPGITGFDQKGDPVRDWSAKDVATWFENKGYLAPLAAYLKEGEDMPNIIAETGKRATLVTLRLYWPSRERGREILEHVLDELDKSGALSVKQRVAVSARMIQQLIEKAEQDKERLVLKRKRLDDEILKAKGSIQVLGEQVESVRKNVVQSQEVILRMRHQIDEVNRNTKELIKLRSEMIDGASDKFALLMYANIIQENIMYLTTLEQRVAALDKEINEYKVEEAEKTDEMANVQFQIEDLIMTRDRELALKAAELDQEIQTLKTQSAALSPVEIVQDPFSPKRPVRPEKLRILTIALMVGCFSAFLGAFLMDFWVRNRDRISTTPGA
jgi:uncharacterized protein involved in exopolysaccharide biosynthesis